MVDRAKKISELTAATSAVGSDLLVFVANATGTAVTKKLTVTSLLSNSANVSAAYLRNSTAPANSSATGVAGEIRYDSSYVYVCVATNTWKRASISTW